MKTTPMAIVTILLVTMACTNDEQEAQRSPTSSFSTTSTSGTTTSPSPPAPVPIPDRLSDGGLPGEVPAALASLKLDPVLVVRSLPKQRWPEVVKACEPSEGRLNDLVQATITIEGATATFHHDDASITACDHTMRDKVIEPWCGSGFAPTPDREYFMRAGGGLSVRCGGSENPIAFMWVGVPPVAKWVVHRRDRFAVVYEVHDGLPVRISAPASRLPGIADPALSVQVEFFDATGHKVDEATLVGRVAG